MIFLEIDGLTYALLSVLKSVGPVTAGELLEALAEISGSTTSCGLIEKGGALFESLIERGVIGIVPAGSDSGSYFDDKESLGSSRPMINELGNS